MFRLARACPARLEVAHPLTSCDDRVHGTLQALRWSLGPSWSHWALALSAMILTATASMVAQAPAPAAQRDLDPAIVRTGAGLFRERCAECHGADAKGVAGHDLTQLWASGATDERVFQTIRAGVPNTLMPSSTAPDDELWALVDLSAQPERRAPRPARPRAATPRTANGFSGRRAAAVTR